MCRFVCNHKCVRLFILLVFYSLKNVASYWNKEFVKDSKTMPSIEIKLSPPENPLPQVEDEIHLLESNRIELEEGMMTKMEEEYNTALLESKKRIKEVIEESLRVFNDKELMAVLLSNATHFEKEVKKHSNNGENGQVSFIQLDHEVIPSSVRVMMSDVDEPDPIIKEKMDQIEQARNDQEIQMFYQESKEMEELTEITLTELEKALKIQLNPYLALMEEMGGHVRNHHTESSKNVHVNAGNQKRNQGAPSFIETQAEPLSNLQQLNVKIGQSDTPYPTVDDYVMNMEKKRDAAERAGRNRVLNMYMNLTKAHHEMIKEELHVALSKIMSQYGGVIDEAYKKSLLDRADAHPVRA
ncbi:hypothetical protein BEWA_029730 [Theileria equi strain WA]|uniref:Uncharacterized protein n=1 Tax=Theileria equi strain WA TaxID=1537102 RepID=L0AX03_THEEQ|nr:hypothetical protein BEWA_029730 [Theileria equi strain WA]AFZ80122.1 hypothetical protein BEWA_029730 [Theileria equi strain WA]|eukprot:XP_004829788.1 hypothetical protein BEWA_029730 [Theileria equi strain WA]